MLGDMEPDLQPIPQKSASERALEIVLGITAELDQTEKGLPE